ncbi:MAG: KEOPS complex kinase/ATPase Bud32 [Thermocladium sp.]
MDRVIIAKGAEAILYLEDWLGLRVLVKERVRKPYRLEEVDKRIRLRRTINESRNMIIASTLVPVPEIYDVDISRFIIRMRYINAPRLMDLLPVRSDLLQLFAKYLAILHLNGIMHGDPTPANALVSSDLYIIDFGLSAKMPGNTLSVEEAAIDLNILMKSLESNNMAELIQVAVDAYQGELGSLGASVINQVKKIRKMARYQFRGIQ